MSVLISYVNEMTTILLRYFGSSHLSLCCLTRLVKTSKTAGFSRALQDFIYLQMFRRWSRIFQAWNLNVIVIIYELYSVIAFTYEPIKRLKGIWWMPWRWEAMKDAIRCDKPWGAANKLWSMDFRMGKPGHLGHPAREANPVNWNI